MLVLVSLGMLVDAQTVPVSPTTANDTVQPEKPTKVVSMEGKNETVVVKETKGENVESEVVIQKKPEATEKKPEAPKKKVVTKKGKKAPLLRKGNEIVEVVEPMRKENYEGDAIYEFEYEYVTEPEFRAFLGYHRPTKRRKKRLTQVRTIRRRSRT